MRRLFVIAVGAAALVVVAGCSDTANYKDTVTVNDQQEIYAKVQPVPKFDWSQDRDTLIQIYAAKNEARNTWTVVTSMTGEAVWSCPSKGFPLAADTQLTNGLKAVANGPVEQPEPNGLYSSKNTDATYVLCVRKNGDIVPIYSELKATTFPFAVEVRDGHIVEVDGAASSITLKSGH